jgi:hypothetical protein
MPSCVASFLTPSAGLVGSDETSDAVGVETRLSLPRRALVPRRSRCRGQIEEGSEAFYVVREVRISSDKVHVL